MPVYYHLKPEAALNNADGMMKVGRNEAALECLAELMKSRRLKSMATSNKVLEDVMRRISSLCVNMRNTMTFKEVVHQYKNMIASVNPKSLEDIVSFYLEAAKAKTEEARKESRALAMDIEDLEVIESPESLMMRSVSMEGAQERSDRTVLAPWLKFLWESYRLVLELLRNNKKFERLYHNVAKEVFNMCIDFNRKAEFRKLCEWLRKDLDKIQNQMANATALPGHAITLNNADTQAMHLETRLEQLDCAFKLEQFSEAYKTIENIWNLLTLNKKMGKPSFMANYYMKLAEIFYRCDTMLFHAATLLKHFLLSRELKKNMGIEELNTLASRVYCAILAIPLPSQREHSADYALENNEIIPPHKQKILSNIIGLSTPPTRLGLLKDLVRLNIHHQAHPELTKLYQHLEVDFHPLQLNKKVRPALEFIADQPTLLPYLPSLQKVMIVRTLLQCSQAYQCMRFDRFVALCATSQILEKRGRDAVEAEAAVVAPDDDADNMAQLSLTVERYVVSQIFQLELPIRLDLREGTVRFQVYNDLGIGSHQLDVGSALFGAITETQQSAWPLTESLCGQLVGLCCALHEVVEKIEPSELNPKRLEAIEYSINCHKSSEQRHHRRLLDRKNLIEDRKVRQEQWLEQQNLEEKRKHEIAQQQFHREEIERLQKEKQARDELREKEQQRELAEQIHRDRVKIIMSSETGSRALQGVSEEKIATMNAKELYQLEYDESLRQLKEKAERSRGLERKHDHITRALNQEEMPVLIKEAELAPQIALKSYEEAYEIKLMKAKKEHQNQLNDKGRLSRLAVDVESFLDDLRKEAQEAYTVAVENWQELCEKERQRLLEEQQAQRKENRRRAYILNKRERKKKEERLAEQENQATQRSGGNNDMMKSKGDFIDKRPAGWRAREAEKEDEWTGRRPPMADTPAAPMSNNWRADARPNIQQARPEPPPPRETPSAQYQVRPRPTQDQSPQVYQPPVARSGFGSEGPRRQTFGGAQASNAMEASNWRSNPTPRPAATEREQTSTQNTWQRGGGGGNTPAAAPVQRGPPPRSMGGDWRQGQAAAAPNSEAYVPPSMRRGASNAAASPAAPTPGKEKPPKKVLVDVDGFITK